MQVSMLMRKIFHMFTVSNSIMQKVKWQLLILIFVMIMLSGIIYIEYTEYIIEVSDIKLVIYLALDLLNFNISLFKILKNQDSSTFDFVMIL